MDLCHTLRRAVCVCVCVCLYVCVCYRESLYGGASFFPRSCQAFVWGVCVFVGVCVCACVCVCVCVCVHFYKELPYKYIHEYMEDHRPQFLSHKKGPL